jgi:hypothetical protein
MQDNGFRNSFISKTDDELLEIVQNKRSDYQDKALIDAEDILRERGILFHIPMSNYPSENNSPSDNIFAPMIVGIIMVALAFFELPSATSSAEAFAVNLTINLVMRFIVLLWTYDLVNKYKLHKVLWMILGLVFGGWALIAINVAIWQRRTPHAAEMPYDEDGHTNSTEHVRTDHNDLDTNDN